VDLSHVQEHLDTLDERLTLAVNALHIAQEEAAKAGNARRLAEEALAKARQAEADANERLAQRSKEHQQLIQAKADVLDTGKQLAALVDRLNKLRIKSAASTNATSVKGGPGHVYGISLSNNTATAKWFKFYDLAAAPNVGVDTPAWSELVPANGGRNIEWQTGITFTNGIAYAITGAAADSDTTATAVDDVHGVLLYA
jgi:translation initiation factor IF-2